MIVGIRTKDVGPLDTNEKAGDIAFAFPDTYVPGLQDVKSYLLAHIPDPINPSTGQVWHEGLLSQLRAEMTESVYGPGPTPEENIIVKARRKGVLYFAQKFSPEELVILDDATQSLPDGATAFGGTAAGGIVSGLIALSDILNK